jgi:flagellin
LVAVSVLNSSVLSGVSPRAADADALASVARAAASSRAFAATIGGISVKTDHLMVAAASRYATEVATLAAVRDNAQYAASLAQTAASALIEIDEKLARLEELAATAEKATTSAQDRLRIDLEFQSLKAEIDRLATTAKFDGTSILNGDGAGGAFVRSFRVGSGTGASDDIQISISAATVSALSSGLAASTVTTASAATAAKAYATAAREALGVRQGEVVGGLQRANAAGLTGDGSAAAAGQAQLDLIEPDTAVDFSRLVAERVANEGDLDLFKDAEQHLRDLLIRLADQMTAEKPPRERATEPKSPTAAADPTPTPSAVDAAAPSPAVEKSE